MPHERVSFDLHAAALAITDDCVGGAEIVVAARPLDRIPLHLVLGGQVIEMPAEHAAVAAISEES